MHNGCPLQTAEALGAYLSNKLPLGAFKRIKTIIHAGCLDK